MSSELLQALNKQVANWTVLYMKLHHYHWFVKGERFFTLHEKFEELYDEANEYIDELAERVLILHEKPLSTLNDCLKVSSLEEAQGNETVEQMVQNVINDFETVCNELKEGIELAEKEGDDVTADIFIGMMGSLQKHNWMLKAFLG